MVACLSRITMSNCMREIINPFKIVFPTFKSFSLFLCWSEWIFQCFTVFSCDDFLPGITQNLPETLPAVMEETELPGGLTSTDRWTQAFWCRLPPTPRVDCFSLLFIGLRHTGPLARSASKTYTPTKHYSLLHRSPKTNSIKHKHGVRNTVRVFQRRVCNSCLWNPSICFCGFRVLSASF